jgi:hypothetical protein
MSCRYNSVFLSKMASGRTPAVEAVVSGLEDVVCIPLLATNGHPATTVRLPRWRSQEGPEGAVWIRWDEVRDDLLKKYAEASGLTWTFPPVPGRLREALKCLPRGAETEAESLERVWDSSNKKGKALSRVALSFVLQRYDVDAAVMRAVTDAIDREGLPLSQTAPRSAMRGGRASAARLDVQAATPQGRKQQQQLASAGNRPVAVGALTTRGAVEISLSVTGKSVQFSSVTTGAGKRARPPLQTMKTRWTFRYEEGFIAAGLLPRTQRRLRDRR